MFKLTQDVRITGKGIQKDVVFANNKPFSLLCGPCQIEGRDHTLKTAKKLQEICDKLGIGFVYKSSFDKANRTSLNAQRGVGLDEGCKILEEVRQEFGVPVITDIHEISQVDAVAQAVDILQIPAFLCRQTDLVVKAAATGRALNIKKGQFLAPWDMENVAKKAASTNNKNIMLCERGASFGYGNLVSDMRSLPIMAKTGFPVIFDATHSVQMPGGNGTSSGGKREFVEPLARAAAAVGVAGFFMEAHENPSAAPSDGPNMIPLDQLEGLLRNLKAIDDVAKENAYMNIISD
ncbi:MAG: 3-deoxy-8-phosphooctulonate synthase [Magnetococcales bacterium]|nr:3-deoxy-8-phosphooctulonate synthase [Magnetococcales bacterium]